MIYNTERQSNHPVFDLSTPDLLALHEKYLAGKFTKTDNYLYFLALFNATKLVDFRVPCIQTDKTQSIIANNIHSLYKMLERIHTLGDERIRNKLELPRFAISPDTRDLANIKHWLDIWEANYNDYQNGYKNTTLIQTLLRKESQLEKKIKDGDDPASYANSLAEWAALAGAFEDDNIILNEHDKEESATTYWKRIIRIAIKGDSIFHIPLFDLEDVIEQCEENIYNGNGAIQAHILMRCLRAAHKKKVEYADLGDFNISSAYKILDANEGVEEANMLAMIMSAPTSEPKESEYPNKTAWRIAKLKYNQAQEYYKANPGERPAVVIGRRIEDILEAPVDPIIMIEESNADYIDNSDADIADDYSSKLGGEL
jgi:hypothetical protein